MRAYVSRAILNKLERRTPEWFTRTEIQILLNTTARAFGVERKRIRSRSCEEALQEYADFTSSCLESGQADPEKLYGEACHTGRIIRRITGFKKSADLERLVFFLYRNIRISMSGCLPGKVIVTSCYFSKIYTPQQCALMSFVDSGIVAGICGGGQLEFSQRITEGCETCTAFYSRRIKK